RYAIIAAGEGSRLAQEGIDAPKPLVKIHGEHLIDRLIRIFMVNEAEEIVVVCNDLTTEVSEHLRQLQNAGELYGNPLPKLRFVVKTTPSSMHSFHELSQLLDDGSDKPFILTTVDTIFREDDFKAYLRAFKQVLNDGADGLMGVTYYIDDEKPLYVGVEEREVWSVECEVRSNEGLKRITGFYDTLKELDSQHPTGNPQHPTSNTQHLISAGIYGLTPRTFQTLNDCIERGESRMRNYQRALVRDGLQLRAYPFLKVLDIDHASDIQKAEKFLNFRIKMKVLALTRDPYFSPNCVEKDRKIMMAVVEKLLAQGCEVTIKDELGLQKYDLETPDIVLNMGRSYRTQALILEHFHGRVINSAAALKENHPRHKIDRLMRENDLPAPPLKGDDGYWVKRDDGFCNGIDDVVYCRDEEELWWTEMDWELNHRRVSLPMVTAHVVGDVVKFYAVGDHFFRYFYPTDDGETKFGHEKINGPAHHYAIDAEQLKNDVNRLAKLAGLEVYGGDAIVRQDGSYCIIDFNDWPSFSRCRDEAAEAIIRLIIAP
ncbi:MAG: NTP transferase domain-containing protein, partial [Prevotella sp.]|nr:NTP transferase domain-containing protein [Prevotella sp.]